MSKKVFVLGAGYAGVEAALTLHKKKKESDDIEIYLVDRNPYHTLFTLLHEVAGNRIAEESVKIPLHEIFHYTDVKIIKDDIEKIDFKENKMFSISGEYSYDYLVMASGGSPDDRDVKGVKENSFTLWSVEDAVKLREHIFDCFNKASREKSSKIRKSLLTFAVGGGGLAGIEIAGELAQWVKQLCKEYSISRDEVKVMIVEAQSSILADLSLPNISKASDYLTKKLKIEIWNSSQIIEVKHDSIKLKTGRDIPTQTIIWTAGVKGSNLIEGLDINTGNDGRVVVDEFTNTQYENVFAVGDVSLFNTGNYYVPPLAEFARQEGRMAAKNILASIRRKDKDILNPQIYGLTVSIGSFFAIGNFIGIRLPGIFSVTLKYLVNIKYLFIIGGFELVSRYLKEEFFHKKQERFLLEKHYSIGSSTFWLVPLRLILGYAWLMEGIIKINEGWLSKAVLTGSPVDGGSSASVTEAGDKLFSIVAAHTPFWYAWIADTFIVPNALIFQFLIVITEIVLGLALVSGTMTFIAGLVALALNINFLISTGMFPEDWWFIPAAICMLGGAGRAFGVDYYLMPYLMRQWRFLVRNKRVKLWLFR